MTRAEPYDVIVIGAGTAGVCAAIQAARLGARTLVVERTGISGGTVTVGNVNFPGLFHAWGRQIIAGVGWDLVERTVLIAGRTLPDFSVPPRHHSHHQIRLDSGLYSCVCEEEMLRSGVSILYHAMIAEVEDGPDCGTATICTKTGLKRLDFGILIDATGDANATVLANLPVNRYGECQPATLGFRLGGYDPTDIDIDEIDAEFRKRIDIGEFRPTDVSWAATASPTLAPLIRRKSGHVSHILCVDADTSEGRSNIEIDARQTLLKLYRFLKRWPHFENLEIALLPNECGIRETVTIRGEASISLDDYTAGRIYHDGICHSFYPIDLHIFGGIGLDFRPLPEGTVPSVPLGVHVPENSRRILVAGRCISSDRHANSALRVQSTCMATGQACGALAGLAKRQNGDFRAVSLHSLRKTLCEHGAIVPPLASTNHRNRNAPPDLDMSRKILQ